MVRPPTPQEEDRCRLSRERRVLLKERVQHSNRIRGLLFGQGVTDYEPLGRDRRQRLAGLRTGDGRSLPPHLRAQIDRELDRLEMVIEQIKAIENELRHAVVAAEGDARASNADQARRDRQRIRDCALDRVPISSLR
jgi:transposase